jgi:hypothetical protein
MPGGGEDQGHGVFGDGLGRADRVGDGNALARRFVEIDEA